MIRLSKPIGKMSNGELSALARAAIRQFQDNLASTSTPTVTTAPWHRLFARLDTLTRPLLTAGWTIVERSEDDAGWDEGTPTPPSAELTLMRANTRAHIEIYEDGVVVVWPPEDAHKANGDPDRDVGPEQAYEPLTQEQAQELFRQVGLLP